MYRFRVPLEGLGFVRDFAVAVFDSTFYCAVKYPVYYNPMGTANDYRVFDEWQKGLGTAYPEEIRLFFDAE